MGRKRKNPIKKQTKPKWFQKQDNFGNFVFDWSLGLPSETWMAIFGVFILIFSVISFLGFFNAAGWMGENISNLISLLFGPFGAYIFIFSMFYLGIIFLIPNHKYQLSKFVGLFLLIISIPTFIHLFVPLEDAKEVASASKGGGLIGSFISVGLRNSIGLFASFLASFSMVGISILMISNFSLRKFLMGNSEKENESGKLNINGQYENKDNSNTVSVIGSLFGKFNNKDKKDETDTKVEVIEIDRRNSAATPVQRPTATWQYPSLDLLKDISEKPSSGDIPKNAEIIVKCLKSFGIAVEKKDANVGPTVTQYTFKPEDGVKLNQVVARQTDLALALSARSLRMEAPIPGKDLVGVEIPNLKAAKVTLKEVLRDNAFRQVKSKLAIALGRDVSGDCCAIDLEKMPHMLIAGSTGSGKSVCINATICSFLFNNSPSDLRIMLVDPKRVELVNYNGIPHLLTPVITEVENTVCALNWAVHEMERRYRMFSELGKRNIIAYNSDPGPEGKLPYIVIVIDELADLMATSSKEVEGSIVRLAQMARATGMHLIIATQRPSVDVLTGLIKANVTSRIAFATASQVDSRTILDLSGAEKLLGNGDMLFIGNGVNKPKRVQGCFVSDSEIEQLTKTLKEQQTANYDESILTFRKAGASVASRGDSLEKDELYDAAVETVVRAGKASATLLQRRLRVGYSRAASLLDMLEADGVIGQSEGSKPRDVLISGSNLPFGDGQSAHLDDFDQ